MTSTTEAQGTLRHAELRIYLSGPPADVQRAQREISEVLSAVAGRDHVAGREP